MTDSGYWTSLWKLVIVINLFLVAVFLSVKLFGALYDRFSTSPLWHSSFWLKFKTPLIILGVVGLLAALFSFIRYDARRELRQAQEYAQTRGWAFSRFDTLGLTARMAAILYDLELDLRYIRTVETGERNLYLFDCLYKNRDAGPRVREWNGTACLVESERFRSATAPLEIITRDWTEMMTSDKVDMGESRFADNFLVLSRDPASAQRTVNASMQSILLEHLQSTLYNPVSVSIGPGGAVVLTGLTAEHERLHDLIILARRIESAME